MSGLIKGFSDMEEFQETPEMTYRTLGESDLEVSAIGLGTWPLGGIKWKHVDVDTALATIHEALDRGINFIDTAPVYGKGRSEELISKVVQERRDEMVIATKAGLNIKDDESYYTDFSYDSILEELDRSRERLGTDVIDLYQMHWPPESIAPERAWNVFLELHRRKKVRAVGVCNFPEPLIEQIQEEGKPHSAQVRYNMLQTQLEETLFPYLRRNNIGVLTCTSLGKGILTGKYEKIPSFDEWDNRSNDPLFEEEEFEDYRTFSEEIAKLANQQNVPPAGLVLNWNQSRPGVTTALAGAHSADQVKELSFGSGWEIPEEVENKISRLQKKHNLTLDQNHEESDDLKDGDS